MVIDSLGYFDGFFPVYIAGVELLLHQILVGVAVGRAYMHERLCVLQLLCCCRRANRKERQTRERDEMSEKRRASRNEGGLRIANILGLRFTDTLAKSEWWEL